MALDRKKILAHAGVFEHHEVHVPSWADDNGDDVVLIRGLTSKEWDEHITMLEGIQPGDDVNQTASLLVKVILAPDGTRMFEDSDAELVGQLGLSEMTKLSQAVMDASGMTEAARKRLEGNSEAAPSGSSSSGSPATSAEPAKSLSVA